MHDLIRPGVATLLLGAPTIALAYIGPGAGITAIGTAIALIGAVLLVIVGFVWYPVKRLMARIRGKNARGSEEGEAAPPS